MVEYIDKQTVLNDMIQYLGIKSKDYLLPSERALYKRVEQAPAADVVERALFDERMAEYQEALDKANEKLAYITGTDDYHYDLEYGREQLNSYVSALVYEETQKRQRGKWEYKPYLYPYGVEHFECSLCGESVVDRTNFCSNCGADMRGEAE